MSLILWDGPAGRNAGEDVLGLSFGFRFVKAKERMGTANLAGSASWPHAFHRR
jgi:hypothetical protein